jgi:hypothetical protein
MTFDTSPPILKRLEGTLRADPLVVRWTMLKKGTAMSVYASRLSYLRCGEYHALNDFWVSVV